MKYCPSCKIVNDDSVSECDCGHVFYVTVTSKNRIANGGNTRKEENFITGCLGILGLMAVAILILTFPSKQDDAVKKTSEPTQISTPYEKEDAFYISRKFVSRKLVAPSTAKFPDPWDPEVSITPTGNKDEFKVIAYVDAQNTFGAMLRKKYMCFVKYVGEGKWECGSVLID